VVPSCQKQKEGILTAGRRPLTVRQKSKDRKHRRIGIPMIEINLQFISMHPVSDFVSAQSDKISNTARSRVVVDVCNHSTLEAEAGGF
jgi:hypothetical protein